MSGSNRYSSLAPFDLHKLLINHYVLTRRGTTKLLQRDKSKDKRDIDVIRENHKFLWDELDEPDTWEKRLAKKYYDKLFKEYCICDLSRYKENKVAMRWQTETEMVTGKGQFVCGEKRCKDSEGLRSWEVNFGYIEDGTKKNALVKLRLCPECSYKLNYKHKRKEINRKSRKRPSSISEDGASSRKLLKTVESTSGETEKSSVNKNEGEDNISEEEHNIWKESNVASEERTRDEDFEDYLEMLLL
uniref:Protein FRA10AC1 homolog n=2 Tax=Homalodisca liturata TaxID=320908 RepID=A0A1B6K2I7_9HEMI